jgi:DNA topoisomerase-3
MICPVCKTGIVRKYEKGYGCSEYKNGCKFFIGRVIAGKEISDIQIEKLISKGKTDLIKGLKKKADDGTEETFDAILIIKDGKLGFAKKKK